MKQREKLLNTYGFDVFDVDENGDLIYREKKVHCCYWHSLQEESDPLEGVNENALRVKLADKMKVWVLFCFKLRGKQ